MIRYPKVLFLYLRFLLYFQEKEGVSIKGWDAADNSAGSLTTSPCLLSFPEAMRT